MNKKNYLKNKHVGILVLTIWTEKQKQIVIHILREKVKEINFCFLRQNKTKKFNHFKMKSVFKTVFSKISSDWSSARVMLKLAGTQW